MLISGKDNPRLKRLAKLCKSRSFRKAEGVFVIEGLRGCADAAASAALGRLEIEAFFYCTSAFGEDSYIGIEAFDGIEERKRFELAEGLADRVSETKNSQGVFIIAKRLDRELSELDAERTPKILVLNAVKDPGNLGTLLRTADAVGIRAAVMTGECAEVYNPKVVRSTMGSLPRLELYIENDFGRVVQTLNSQGVTVCAAVVRNGEAIPGFEFPERCAAVIGNEARGLSEEDAELCHRRVTITMKGSAESLNAAAAGSIIIWEMLRG